MSIHSFYTVIRSMRGVSWGGTVTGGEVPGVIGGECHGRVVSHEGSAIITPLGRLSSTPPSSASSLSSAPVLHIFTHLSMSTQVCENTHTQVCENACCGLLPRQALPGCSWHAPPPRTGSDQMSARVVSRHSWIYELNLLS